MALVAVLTLFFSMLNGNDSPGHLRAVLEGAMPLFVMLRLGRTKSLPETSLLFCISVVLFWSSCLPHFHPLFRHCLVPNQYGMRLCIIMLTLFYLFAFAEAALTFRNCSLEIEPRLPSKHLQENDANVRFMTYLLLALIFLFLFWLVYGLVTGWAPDWILFVFEAIAATAGALGLALWHPNLVGHKIRMLTHANALVMFNIWALAIAFLFIKTPEHTTTKGIRVLPAVQGIATQQQH